MDDQKIINDTIRLLQGEWIDYNRDIYLSIEGFKIKDIEGLCSLLECDFEITWQEQASACRITSQGMGWLNDSFWLNENEFTLVAGSGRIGDYGEHRYSFQKKRENVLS